MLRSKGFSLVELLTVIAIIAILAAIIFPVMATVKAKARQQACISQLHELAMRADMYKKDNGRYPSTLGPKWRSAEGIEEIKAGTGSGATDPGIYIRGYIDNFKMFHCPSDISTDTTAGSPTYMTDVSNALSAVSVYTYSSYDFFMGAPDIPTGIRYAYRWADLNGGVLTTLAPAAPYPIGTTDTVALQQQDYQRQLCWRTPPSDTVLTWCSFHAEDPEGVSPVGMAVYVFVDGHTATVPADVAKACRWRVRFK